MENLLGFLEGNITSIIALVVAIVSGAFSIIATKRSSKPQMVQPYLQYLMKKVETLTERISKGQPCQLESDISRVEGQMEATKAIREGYDYRVSIFLNESDLFTECESQYKKLIPKRDAIEKSNQYQVLTLYFKDNIEQVNLEELKDAPYKDFNTFISAMIQFSDDMDNLMRAEKKETLKLIKKISLK